MGRGGGVSEVYDDTPCGLGEAPLWRQLMQLDSEERRSLMTLLPLATHFMEHDTNPEPTAQQAMRAALCYARQLLAISE